MWFSSRGNFFIAAVGIYVSVIVSIIDVPTIILFGIEVFFFIDIQSGWIVKQITVEKIAKHKRRMDPCCVILSRFGVAVRDHCVLLFSLSVGLKSSVAELVDGLAC